MEPGRAAEGVGVVDVVVGGGVGVASSSFFFFLEFGSAAGVEVASDDVAVVGQTVVETFRVLAGRAGHRALFGGVGPGGAAEVIVAGVVGFGGESGGR